MGRFECEGNAKNPQSPLSLNLDWMLLSVVQSADRRDLEVEYKMLGM